MAHPKAVARALRKRAPDAVLVVFETGPLATWFRRKLAAEDLPAVCIAARHAKAALDTAQNKTGATMRAEQSLPKRLRRGGRSQLVGISTGLATHLRGVMKTFGLIVPAAGGF